MTEIEEKIEILQDLSAVIAGHLQEIQSLRKQAKEEIDGDGLTEATCQKMARKMALLHENTARLHNGGHLIHQSMAAFLPEGMNEGNKEWPPQP